MLILRLIRFPNLFIVAFTQYLIYYRILLPYFHAAELSPKLSTSHLFLLVFSTILIAAGGYIINDIVDYEIDIINKPDKVFIGNGISKPQAWKLYWFCGILGFLCSLYLAIATDNLGLLFIFPLAVGLLHLYSLHLKKQVLTGNLIVALFCAFVPGILLLAEASNVGHVVPSEMIGFKKMWILVGGYMLFAFYTTLLREVVKDIEDMAGDLVAKCRTLPIVFGVEKAKKWGLLMALLVLFALTVFAYDSRLDGINYVDIYVYLLLILPTIYIFVQLISAREKNDFSHLSFSIKLLMLFGLVYLMIG